MRIGPWRRGAVALLGIALVAGAAVAANNDDRTAAEAALKEVDTSPRKDVARELSQRAKAALDRGAKLRRGGDEPHARLADAAARTWAEAARDHLRAVEVEERAADARRSAADAGAAADRERALLEEGIAQSGRLRAQLGAGSREAREQPARTSAQANADAGAAAPSQPRKKPAADGGAP